MKLLDRIAIFLDIDGYIVLCYEDRILKRIIDLKEYSVYYAESAANNWESGIID